MTGPFRLFSQPEHFCSFADYGHILETTRRIKPRSVLEFGPGWSTLALIEGGANSIESCEDDRAWAATWRERIEVAHRAIVQIHEYRWPHLPFALRNAARPRYFDLALVDGPHDLSLRPAVVAHCLAVCDWILVPTEESEGPALRAEVLGLAVKAGREVEWNETGPLAGGYALVHPPC